MLCGGGGGFTSGLVTPVRLAVLSLRATVGFAGTVGLLEAGCCGWKALRVCWNRSRRSASLSPSSVTVALSQPCDGGHWLPGACIRGDGTGCRDDTGVGLACCCGFTTVDMGGCIGGGGLTGLGLFTYSWSKSFGCGPSVGLGGGPADANDCGGTAGTGYFCTGIAGAGLVGTPGAGRDGNGLSS